jgi:hypothetical protein
MQTTLAFGLAVSGLLAVSCSSNDGGDDFDACAIVTAEDATQLFTEPASPSDGTVVTDPNFAGECLWEWTNADNDSRLLQFQVWNGTQYYSAPTDSEPYDIGEEGYLRVHPVGGVDISWVQNGQTIGIFYSTVGTSIPNATTQVDDVKALAQKTSGLL